jgi:hypothetical protein
MKARIRREKRFQRRVEMLGGCDAVRLGHGILGV